VINVRDEFRKTQCITDHPGFHPGCLDIHVLKVAYFQYRQQVGERSEQNTEYDCIIFQFLLVVF